MKAIFKLTLVLGLFLAYSINILAQEEPNGSGSALKIPTTDKESTNPSSRFLFNRDAKRFVVGIQAGTSIFHGDADKIKLGWAVGANFRWNPSHVLGLRAVFNYGNVRADVEKPAKLGMSFYEFSTSILEYQAQMVLTLGNISFFKRKWDWNLYTLAGVGQVRLNSKADYEFVPNGTLPAVPGSAEYKRTHIIFTYGLGLKRNISKSIDIGLEYGMRWVRTDSIDILNAPIHPNRKFDAYSLPQVIVNIKLGKSGKEHLDWINPISSVYEDLSKLEEKIDKLDKDSDGDGVADRFDKEENTPAGAKVWGSGEAVDLDNDGVPDVNDQEPSTPPGAKVDPNTGIAEDQDEDGVPDILDLSPDTDPKYLVNHQGIPIMMKENPGNINIGGDDGSGDAGGAGNKNITNINNMSGGISFLPAVFFATDVDEPYPTHLPDLQGVALALKNNPGIRLEIIGNADLRNDDGYNLRLAQRRADNVKKILVKFGADPARLITKTNGERVPITTGSGSRHLQANRRVQFFIVK